MNLDFQFLVIVAVVGLVAGWLAGQIVKGYGFGLVGNLVVGLAGAFIVAWGLPKLHVALPVVGGPIVNTILWATVGAVVLLLIVGMVRKAA